MECGVHGLLGALAVKRVEMVHGSGDDFAIIQNLLLMAHIVWVSETSNKTAVLSLLVQVVSITRSFFACKVACSLHQKLEKK